MARANAELCGHGLLIGMWPRGKLWGVLPPQNWRKEKDAGAAAAGEAGIHLCVISWGPTSSGLALPACVLIHAFPALPPSRCGLLLLMGEAVRSEPGILGLFPWPVDILAPPCPSPGAQGQGLFPAVRWLH